MPKTPGEIFWWTWHLDNKGENWGNIEVFASKHLYIYSKGEIYFTYGIRNTKSTCWFILLLPETGKVSISYSQPLTFRFIRHVCFDNGILRLTMTVLKSAAHMIGTTPSLGSHHRDSKKVSMTKSSLSSLMPLGLFQAVRGMAASELLEHSVSCFCQHVTDGQFTYVFHISRECLRTAFFKSLHCPSASSSQHKAWAKQRLPHYVLATSRVDKACESVLSGCAPFGSSLRRVQGGKGQPRSRPGRFTRQWGDKYLNSVKGHGFCLQSLKNPKISYTNMKSSIFSWKIRSCTIGPTL